MEDQYFIAVDVNMGRIDDGEKDRRTIFVQGVSFQLQEADFEAAFSEIGPVRKSFLLRNKGHERHKGSGFVQFAVPEDAEKAVQQYHGKKLAGRAVQVVSALKRAPLAERKLKKREGPEPSAAEAEELQPAKRAKLSRLDGGDKQKLVRTVALGNLTAKSAPLAVKLASSLGEVVDIVNPVPDEEVESAKLKQDGCSSYVVYITYQTVKMAVDAVAQLHGHFLDTEAPPRKGKGKPDVSGQQVEGLRLWARQVKGEGAFVKKWRIILRNLPFNVKKDDLHRLLDASGFVWELTIPSTAEGKPRGFAFAAFTSRAHAERAIKTVNGQSLKGRTIAVDWAVSKVAFQVAPEAMAEEAAKSAGTYDPELDGSNEDDDDDQSVLAAKDVNLSQDAAEGDAHAAASNQLQSEKSLLKRVAQQFALADNDADVTEERVPASKAPGDKAAESPAAAERVGRSKTGSEAGPGPYSIADNEATKSRPPSDAVGKTVFVRGLPVEVSKQQLQARLESFGEINSCRIVLNPTTQKPKGTAFVEFKSTASASKAAEASEKGRTGKGPGISVGGRPLEVNMAVTQADARVMAAQKASGRNPKDNRHLYLAKEGQIEEGSPAWEDMSKGDQQKRTRAAQEKSTKLRSPNFYVSPTRICLRNVPYSMDEKSLKSLLLAAVKERAAKAVPKLKQVKVLRDAEKKRPDGEPASKGIAFAEFTDHEHAMCALRQLNNNPAPFGQDRRPIVEFAIENAQTTKKREQREAGKKGHKIAKTAATQEGQKSKSEVRVGDQADVEDPPETAEARKMSRRAVKSAKVVVQPAVDRPDEQTKSARPGKKAKQLKGLKADKPEQDGQGGEGSAQASGGKRKRLKEGKPRISLNAEQQRPGKVQKSEGAQAGVARPQRSEGAQAAVARPQSKREKGKSSLGRQKKQTGDKRDDFDTLVAKYKTSLFREDRSKSAAKDRGASLKRWFE